MGGLIVIDGSEGARLDPAVHDVTLGGLIRRSADVFGDRTAVVWPDGAITYRDLNREVNRLAHALLKLGLRGGDRLAIVSENRPEYVVSYLAAAKIGVIVVGINIRWHPEEALHSLSASEPRALMVSGRFQSLLDEMRSRLDPTLMTIALDEGAAAQDLNFSHLVAGGSPEEPLVAVQGSDIHNILYTSGTTGHPKGAMISQRAAVLRGLRIAQWFGLTESDGHVGWLPLFHVGGDESLYATLVTGGCFAALPAFDPAVMFRLIEQHRLTWTILVPGTVTAFAQHPELGRHDLSSLRFAGGYADLLSDSVLEEFSSAVGIPYYDAYGQTETSYLVAWHNTPSGSLPTRRKRPAPLLDIRLVDENMRDVPVGATGEMVVRGPTLMSGYWRDPRATAEAFRGGWLHTGDLFVRHEDGTVQFRDRQKSLIKTGGENVYPAEVERVLSQLPAVQEVCVVGVPDDKWGEAVHAAIVVRPGHRLTWGEVDAACLTHLARYKRPRGVTFIEEHEVPRSTTGKIQRTAMVAQLLQRK